MRLLNVIYLNKISPITFLDDIEGNKHIISFQVKADVSDDTEPQLMEPAKVSEWKWFSKNELPENISRNLRILIDSGKLDF